MLDNNTGIYIHVPFCRNKCPYCDFYSLIENADTMDRYISAIVFELKTRQRLNEFVSGSLSADTVYFGGGTPSLMPPKGFKNILEAVRDNFTLSENAEITVECNPTSFSEQLISALADVGVNRISLGLQSAVDSERKALGRRSNASDVYKAMELCRKYGINNISLDIMLGIPKQTEESLIKTLDFCTASGASHISAYMLKIEDGTPFYKLSEKLSLPDEDEVCELYELCSETLINNGFEHYEISNFAKSGNRSRHNMKYWTLKNYIGIGPAAHSYYNGKRFYFSRDTEGFINGERAVFDGYGGDVSEYIMLSLRVSDGIDLDYMSCKYGEEITADTIKRAQLYTELHLAEIKNNRLYLTRKGFLLSNTVICDIIG